MHRSTYNGRSNTGVLPSTLIKVSGRTFCEESDNLICTRNKTKVKQFGSAYLSPCEHGKIHVNTVRIQVEDDSVALNEIPRRRDCHNEISKCYFN